MNAISRHAGDLDRGSSGSTVGNRPPPHARWFALGSLVAVLALSACGGGGDSGAAVFNVAPVVNGLPVSGVLFVPGAAQDFRISAGQSLELDADEPVLWTLIVGGNAITSIGTTVSYAGVEITETVLTPSRVALDTFAPFFLPAPVPITLTATSTIDSALVATINVLITN